MSKHNNNLSQSSSKRCSCGRCISIGEEARIGHSFGYTCPDCKYRQYSQINPQQFYASFNLTNSKTETNDAIPIIKRRL